jgi:hypothetical protein
MKVDAQEKILYRRIMMQNSQTYVVSVMDQKMGASQMMKLKIFESNTNEQHLFVFNITDIFTAEELELLEKKPDTATP